MYPGRRTSWRRICSRRQITARSVAATPTATPIPVDILLSFDIAAVIAPRRDRTDADGLADLPPCPAVCERRVHEQDRRLALAPLRVLALAAAHPRAHQLALQRGLRRHVPTIHGFADDAVADPRQRRHTSGIAGVLRCGEDVRLLWASATVLGPASR